MVESYIVVDIEASGPIPEKYSMLSFGACKAFDTHKTFYREIKPLNGNFVKKSLEVANLSMEKLMKHGKLPKQAMLEFEEWIYLVCGDDEPFFVAFPAPFDWMFINYYFHKFLGRNPFNRNFLDMKSYFAGMEKLPIKEATREKLFRRFPTRKKHTHNALDDAVAYAEIFEQMLKQE
jgi:DNA polymerase III epsilon subunit-like protein